MRLKLLKTCEVDGKPLLPGAIFESDDNELIDQMIEKGLATLLPQSSFESQGRDVPAGRNKFIAASYNAYENEGGSKDGNSGGESGTGGFKSLSEVLLSVKDARLKGDFDPRLKALNETTSSQGGFLVPPGYSGQVLREAIDVSPILNRCRRVPVSNSNTTIPAVDESSRADDVYGGVVWRWMGEGETKQESQPKFRQIGVNLHKIAGITVVSDELLEDSNGIANSLLPALMGEGLRFQLADAVFSGSGASMPLGVLNSGATVVVAKEAGPQGAGTLVYENVIKMLSRLAPSSFPTACWFIHQSVIPALFTMKLIVGAGGTAVYLPGDSGAVPQMLFGIPVVITELCRPLGTQGDIMLLDLQQYLLCSRGELRIDVSNAPRFVNDETTFRIVHRVDGMPWWDLPRTPKYGTETVSPFVTLETR